MPYPYSYREEHVLCQHGQEQTGQEQHRIHVLLWTARSKGKLPPVVCVHGLTRRAEDYIHLGEALSETRDVYSFSMAGRGKSDPIPPNLYTYQQYTADCQFLLSHYGLELTDWVGTSMGGLIGMLIAGAEGPGSSPIRRFVLNDIGPFVTAASLRRLAIRVTGYAGAPFKTRKDAEAYCRFSWGAFNITGQKDWDAFADFNIVHKDGGFYLHYDPAVVDGMRKPEAIPDVNLWMFYSRITCPTLVLHGEQSDLLTPDIMADMATLGPRPKFVTFSGCGHAPALIEPEQIGAVAGFLNQP
jgi:pimeloyl-ACP methyl ester carboxylesterase